MRSFIQISLLLALLVTVALSTSRYVPKHAKPVDASLEDINYPVPAPKEQSNANSETEAQTKINTQGTYTQTETYNDGNEVVTKTTYCLNGECVEKTSRGKAGSHSYSYSSSKTVNNVQVTYSNINGEETLRVSGVDLSLITNEIKQRLIKEFRNELNIPADQ
ncbi:hypothetical protein SAMD00019534_042640 [Acytostelium subglobosum LB1]|uniref:hypothetical protein n=1 Tax=Acytostelium subglobosum LB1 TaxID=1410327 RepID=UPI000644E258|nr:hypothetical protein SAMD00019534_042640 [Acytostelium subglobosum LB1]GAM21089.1 hypothetical protein SAMD00019534_042640 [Acytostelium subglobosum LB1]|eukprot:XP_012756223.1 hypothetical protein SAMD00019534_042640 [Acytostelium subglobosum LB1]